LGRQELDGEIIEDAARAARRRCAAAAPHRSRGRSAGVE
jgi:hypothetical protein